ncbi:MAG TPA: HD domain-containing protein [Gelidibacter sp.]|uniref:HD domain-containing protein n=1 Tax=Gelidibacter sp. TaxID=2018083 RepID=UPI002B7A3A14|nr:HD domain-containing protein [Gelidibacter sp.]HXJ97824.1 HD domain-containing protein [Gelidibacter sp.]
MKIKENQIDKTIAFVKQQLANAEGGHDWFHIERVYNNALTIAKHENVNVFVVKLGALLHDIADSKFHNGDEAIGPKIAESFMRSIAIENHVIEHVINIIKNISFAGGKNPQSFKAPELDVVQDADRLDAIGAIGIARTFNYGGFKNRPLFDPSIKPNLEMTKAEYKASTAPTINHFYEKLLFLKDKMNTKTGLQMAKERHAYMEQFLDQFHAEWNGEK